MADSSKHAKGIMVPRRRPAGSSSYVEQVGENVPPSSLMSLWKRQVRAVQTSLKPSSRAGSESSKCKYRSVAYVSIVHRKGRDFTIPPECERKLDPQMANRWHVSDLVPRKGD